MKRHNPATVRVVEPPYRDIYAHAVETRLGTARQLHISGQLGIDKDGHLSESFADQCRQALRNLENILEAASMTKAHVVKASYFVTRAEDLPDLNAVRAEQWGGVTPAVTTLLVAGLVRPEFLVEIEVLAIDEGDLA